MGQDPRHAVGERVGLDQPRSTQLLLLVPKAPADDSIQQLYLKWNGYDCCWNVEMIGLKFHSMSAEALQRERRQMQAMWICIGETWGVFTLGDTRK